MYRGEHSPSRYLNYGDIRHTYKWGIVRKLLLCRFCSRSTNGLYAPQDFDLPKRLGRLGMDARTESENTELLAVTSLKIEPLDIMSSSTSSWSSAPMHRRTSVINRSALVLELSNRRHRLCLRGRRTNIVTSLGLFSGLTFATSPSSA
jgi:hypothetical protein